MPEESLMSSPGSVNSPPRNSINSPGTERSGNPRMRQEASYHQRDTAYNRPSSESRSTPDRYQQNASYSQNRQGRSDSSSRYNKSNGYPAYSGRMTLATSEPDMGQRSPNRPSYGNTSASSGYNSDIARRSYDPLPSNNTYSPSPQGVSRTLPNQGQGYFPWWWPKDS